MTRAMIVVDVQQDFIEGGSLAVAGGKRVSQLIADSIRYYKEGNSGLFDYFVATKDFHDPYTDNGGHFGNPPDFVDTWPPHCVLSTDGSLFAPAIADVAHHFDAIFYKGQGEPAYSGFQGRTNPVSPDKGSSLHDWLHSRNVTELTVVGIATDYCVKATAIDAINLGYDVRIPARLTVAVGGDDAKLETLIQIRGLQDKSSERIN